MKYFKNGTTDREISRVALGCMRIADMTPQEADIELSAEDWYKIYRAAGYELP